MKIIEGDHAGCRTQIIKGIGSGPALRISTGLMKTESRKIPGDMETIKLLNKDEGRTVGQFLLILLLAITLIGIPVAILLAIFWKRVDFSIGVKTKQGEKFVAQGDAGDWKVFKKFIGVGSMGEF